MRYVKRYYFLTPICKGAGLGQRLPTKFGLLVDRPLEASGSLTHLAPLNSCGFVIPIRAQEYGLKQNASSVSIIFARGLFKAWLVLRHLHSRGLQVLDGLVLLESSENITFFITTSGNSIGFGPMQRTAPTETFGGSKNLCVQPHRTAHRSNLVAYTLQQTIQRAWVERDQLEWPEGTYTSSGRHLTTSQHIP